MIHEEVPAVQMMARVKERQFLWLVSLLEPQFVLVLVDWDCTIHEEVPLSVQMMARVKERQSHWMVPMLEAELDLDLEGLSAEAWETDLDRRLVFPLA